MLGAAIAQIITVNRGDDHVLQAQVGNGHRKVLRLVQVQRLGTAMPHVAERAAPGADVAHDHEGGGAAREALAQVRAGGFFADAVQLVLAQQLLDAVYLGRDRDTHADPVRLLGQLVGGDDLDRDARDLVGASQLDPGFDLFGGGTRSSVLGWDQVRHGFLHSSHIQSIPPVRVVCSA